MALHKTNWEKSLMKTIIENVRSRLLLQLNLN